MDDMALDADRHRRYAQTNIPIALQRRICFMAQLAEPARLRGKVCQTDKYLRDNLLILLARSEQLNTKGYGRSFTNGGTQISKDLPRCIMRTARRRLLAKCMIRRQRLSQANICLRRCRAWRSVGWAHSTTSTAAPATASLRQPLQPTATIVAPVWRCDRLRPPLQVYAGHLRQPKRDNRQCNFLIWHNGALVSNGKLKADLPFLSLCGIQRKTKPSCEARPKLPQVVSNCKEYGDEIGKSLRYRMPRICLL